jgi:hypothetical protein
MKTTKYVVAVAAIRTILNRTVCLALVSGVLVSLAAALPLKADTVFTNFGSPGQTYNNNASWTLGQNVYAFPFVASESATLTDIMLPLAGTGSVNVYLLSASGGTPDSVLATLTTAGSLGNTFSILTYTCSTCAQLTAGTTYFAVAQDSGGFASWADSNSDSGTFYYSPGSGLGPWFPVGPAPAAFTAFEVDGTPLTSTPEPSSLLLLGTGLLGLAGMTWRKKLFA